MGHFRYAIHYNVIRNLFLVWNKSRSVVGCLEFVPEIEQCCHDHQRHNAATACLPRPRGYFWLLTNRSNCTSVSHAAASLRRLKENGFKVIVETRKKGYGLWLNIAIAHARAEICTQPMIISRQLTESKHSREFPAILGISHDISHDLFCKGRSVTDLLMTFRISHRWRQPRRRHHVGAVPLLLLRWTWRRPWPAAPPLVGRLLICRFPIVLVVFTRLPDGP